MDSSTLERFTHEAAALLREMVAIPSPSFEEDGVHSLLRTRLSERGLQCEEVRNNLICRGSGWEDGRKTLMLCAHMDTVAPSKDYSFDPYGSEADKAASRISEITGKKLSPDEVIAGLGSNDDGASVVTMAAAFEYLAQEKLPFNLMLVISCEEERSGENGMRHLWGNVINPDWAIVGEPTCMKAATSERGLLVIDGSAHGVAGHAARGEGINALYIAMDDIMKLRAHHFEKISPRMGEVRMTVTQVSAGSAHNVIPDRCDFVVDIRPTEKYSNEEIVQELQAICSSTLKARNLMNRSSSSHEDSPLVRCANLIGADTFSSPTTSDWMRLGCDAIKMGPGDSSRSHKADEYVLVEEIREAIAKYTEFISLLAKEIERI